MFELGNMVLDELECDELRVNKLTVSDINGVTAAELNNLKGIDTSKTVQEQINELSEGLDDLADGWK